MDLTNWFNIVAYILIGFFSLKLLRKGELVTAITLGSLALHGLLFNGVFLYRDIYWESCPPVCGLQHWSAAIRLHALVAILTSMIYRLYVDKR